MGSVIQMEAHQNNFRLSMEEFLQEHFSDALGDDVNLLSLPGGLDLIHDKYVGREKQAA